MAEFNKNVDPSDEGLAVHLTDVVQKLPGEVRTLVKLILYHSVQAIGCESKVAALWRTKGPPWRRRVARALQDLRNVCEHTEFLVYQCTGKEDEKPHYQREDYSDLDQLPQKEQEALTGLCEALLRVGTMLPNLVLMTRNDTELHDPVAEVVGFLLAMLEKVSENLQRLIGKTEEGPDGSEEPEREKPARPEAASIFGKRWPGEVN
jgi:hypothetical protein